MSIEQLVQALETTAALVRVDLPDTEQLGAFEKQFGEKQKELMRVAEFGGLRPSFVWWQMAGLWPSGAGWVVLLRRAMFQGQAPQIPAKNGGMKLRHE